MSLLTSKSRHPANITGMHPFKFSPHRWPQPTALTIAPLNKIINHVEYKATVMNQSHHSFPFTPKQEIEIEKKKSMRRMLESAWHRFPLQLQECEGRELHFGWEKKLSGEKKNRVHLFMFLIMGQLEQLQVILDTWCLARCIDRDLSQARHLRFGEAAY